ncbi:MAG: hypothetical protein AB8G96_09740 [Phycisphaerales bacterium]
MPAKRSRTIRWRSCLEDIHARGGAIDVAIARDTDDGPVQQLVWRVSLLGLDTETMTIEEPATMGTPIRLKDGVDLVGIMSVGQNRWTFKTRNLGRTEANLNAYRTVRAYRLAMPDHVVRCQRRDFFRLSVAGLDLPTVEAWPLLDASSVVVAEQAVMLAAKRAEEGHTVAPVNFEDPGLRPELGPKFTGTILNLGGGGMGLRIPPEHARSVARHRQFWMRISMPESMPTPILASAKVAHTHMQNDQSVYAGLQFDFSQHKDYQKFVVDQICKFVVQQQRLQLQRRAELGEPQTEGDDGDWFEQREAA